MTKENYIDNQSAPTIDEIAKAIVEQEYEQYRKKHRLNRKNKTDKFQSEFDKIE